MQVSCKLNDMTALCCIWMTAVNDKAVPKIQLPWLDKCSNVSEMQNAYLTLQVNCKLDEVTALNCIRMASVDDTAVLAKHSFLGSCQALLLAAPAAVVDTVLIHPVQTTELKSTALNERLAE